MRLIVVGSGSFIAQHVGKVAAANGVAIISMRHNANVSAIVRPGDTVLNCSLHPAYRNGVYVEEQDMDLQVARAAIKVGARVAMLSTRRVYPENCRWNATERCPATGDETAYGRNKAKSEAEIRKLGGGLVSIFRMSNVFGYEYSPDRGRRTFLAQLSWTLRHENAVHFDMHPDTRRDFIPVEICAQALLSALKHGEGGTYNLGAGFPVRCGDVADWVMHGFGGGELLIDPPVVKDEFFLNMDGWRSIFGHYPVEVHELSRYCIELGRKLKCEKF